ncbi:MAG: exonuclease RecJ [Halodesulfurarchaeum sp.]
MATTGRSTAAPSSPEAIAERLASADFVHVVGHADGDSLAAAGILGKALHHVEVPLQLSIEDRPQRGEERLSQAEGTVIGLGLGADGEHSGPGALSVSRPPLATTAHEIATALGAEPDPILALAGAVAAGSVPGGPPLSEAKDLGVETRPGLAIPVDDPTDGLVHTGLVHGEFSGSEDATAAFLERLALPEDLPAEDRRRLASAVAVSATAAPGGTRAAEAIGRAIAPLVIPATSQRGSAQSSFVASGFRTVGGIADVLESLSRTDPGRGTSLVLGHGDVTEALEIWRRHNRAVHQELETTELTEYDAIAVFEGETADPWTTARLLRDFGTDRPRVLARRDDRIVLATTEAGAREQLTEATGRATVGGRPDLAATSVDRPTSEILESIEEKEPQGGAATQGDSR